MAISSLRIFSPYSGPAGTAPSGAGNGAANRVAIWQDGTTLTSYAQFIVNNTGIMFRVGVGTQGTLADTTAYGLYADPLFPSTTTAQASCIVGSLKTQNASFTVPIATTLFCEPPSKGAASTITRMVHIYGAIPTVGTNNAILGDNTSFTGSWGLHLTTPTQNLMAGSLVLATSALSTSATDGFLYIPTCAGTPSGVPTARTGTVPLVYDTTNNKIAVYNGAAWKQTAALA